MNTTRTRLRAAVVIPTVLAGLLLSGLAGGIASASSPTGPAATTPARAANAAAPAAPEAVGSAAGFLFYVIPDPQPLCLTPAGSNITADPAIDRNACAFAESSRSPDRAVR